MADVLAKSLAIGNTDTRTRCITRKWYQGSGLGHALSPAWSGFGDFCRSLLADSRVFPQNYSSILRHFPSRPRSGAIP